MTHLRINLTTISVNLGPGHFCRPYVTHRWHCVSFEDCAIPQSLWNASIRRHF